MNPTTLLDIFKDMTPEKFEASGNFNVMLVLHREMIAKLNVSDTLAAELIGKMDISVADWAYNKEPETFHAMAVAMVDALVILLRVLGDKWGYKAAWAYTEQAATKMSLTYG